MYKPQIEPLYLNPDDTHFNYNAKKNETTIFKVNLTPFYLLLALLISIGSSNLFMTCYLNSRHSYKNIEPNYGKKIIFSFSCPEFFYLKILIFSSTIRNRE